MHADLTVAQTILAQLGGRRFLAMTGAKNLVGSADTLAFRLPTNFATNKANICRITLNGLDLYDLDLYDLEFCRLRAGKVTLVSRDSKCVRRRLAMHVYGSHRA